MCLRRQADKAVRKLPIKRGRTEVSALSKLAALVPSPAWENYHENLDSFFGLYDARHSGAR
jgi:hypothetical protein